MGRKVIEHFVYLAEGGKTIQFTFSGGEPLVAFEILRPLTQYAWQCASEAGIEARFALKTNGTILNSKIIQYLREYSVDVVVSIDGAAETHDRNRRTTGGRKTAAAVERSLRTLIDESIPCSASLTVHPDSVLDVIRNVHYLHALGLQKIDVAPAYGTVAWTNQQSELLARSLDEIGKYVRHVNGDATQLVVGPLYQDSEHIGGMLSETWGCHAGVTNLAYLPNGDIAGCSALAMLAHRFPELIVGNAIDGIAADSTERITSLSQAPRQHRPACSGCLAADNCAGGCLAINYATTGMPLMPPDVYCKTISAIPAAWHTAWAPPLQAHIC